MHSQLSTWTMNRRHNMSETVISIKDLSKSFGDHEVLRKIDIDVHSGEVICIVGSSGSGKSTLLRCINKLEKQTSGKILYHDKEVRNVQKDINDYRSKVGMVFQQPNPFPMSIYDNVAYGPRIHGIKNKAQLDEIVERSLKGAALWDEVSDRLKKSALGLSGGQQQRVAIARAVVANPKLILADEPTGNLDSKNGKEVMGLLSELNKEGTTIVMVTHSQHDAGYADRIINLFDGQVVTEVSM